MWRRGDGRNRRIPSDLQCLHSLLKGVVSRLMKKGKRILIVDDDFWLLLSLRRLLERCGYEVLIASDKAAAVSITEQRRPEAVLVDLLLGFENGIEVVWQLRAIMPNLPVVLMSGCLGDEPAKLAIIYGAAFVGKDEMTHLPALLHRLLKKKG